MLKIVPQGTLVMIDGQPRVRITEEIIRVRPNGQSERELKETDESLERYADMIDNAVGICAQEMERLISHSEFRYVDPYGLKPVREKRIQQNQEMKAKVIKLIRKMIYAKSLKELDEAYEEIKKIIDNAKSILIMQYTEEEEKIRNWLISDNTHGNREYTLAGMPKEKIRQVISNGLSMKKLIDEYLETIYQHLAYKFEIQDGAKKTQKLSDTKSEPKIETTSLEKEEIESVSSLIERRKAAELKRDELLRAKRALESKAELSGLFEIEHYEAPVYRKNPNPVDGFIAGYETKTRFKNGTDEQREEHYEELRKITAEIKKIEEIIETLSETIQAKRQIATSEPKVETMQGEVEDRFFGLGKFGQALSRVLSSRKTLEGTGETTEIKGKAK